MKKAIAILLSIMIAFMMTATNLAGVYNDAVLVYAVEEAETDGGADNQDELAATQSDGASEDAPENGTPGAPQENPPTGKNDGTPEAPQGNIPAAITDAAPENAGADADTQNTTQEIITPENAASAVTFTVTFDANGHGTAPDAVSAESGQTITKPSDPTADGFTFTGWYCDATATAVWNFDRDTVVENIILYAGWMEEAPVQTAETSVQQDNATAEQQGEAGQDETASDAATSKKNENADNKENETTSETPADDAEPESDANEDKKDENEDEIADADEIHEDAEAFPAFSQSGLASGITVTVTANEGVFPAGARLSVTGVSSRQQTMAEKAADEVCMDAADIVSSYTLDIKVCSAEGKELQPANGQDVQISFYATEIADSNLDVSVYHIEGNHAEELAVSTSGSTATAVTGGFSFYVVRLSYNNNGRHYYFGRSGPWANWISIDEIRTEIGLPSGTVTSLTSSHPNVIEARQNGSGAWGVQCRQEQIPDGVTLTATIEGTDHTIVVDNAPPSQQGSYNGFEWALFSYERVLVLSGTGSVESVGPVQSLPWYTSAPQSMLQEVIIEEGITRVSHTIFVHAGQLTTVHLPSSLTSITWNGSGDGCDNLREFIYPGTKAQWQNVSGYDSMPQSMYVRCSDSIYSNIQNNVTLTVQGTVSGSNDTAEIVGGAADIPYGNTVTVKVTADKQKVEKVVLKHNSDPADDEILRMNYYDGTSEIYSFTMPAYAVTVDVTWKPSDSNEYKITTSVTDGKGSVRVAELVNGPGRINGYAGGQYMVFATPEEGYQNLSDGVTITNLKDQSKVTVGAMSEYYPFTMPTAPIKVEVQFMASIYNLTATYDSSKGEVKFFDRDVSAIAHTDEPAQFTARPNAGCAIDTISYTWNGNTTTIPVSGESYTFTMPPGDTNVTVVFKEVPGIPVIRETPTALPQGKTGEEYRYVLQADGEAPIEWSWSEGRRGGNPEHPPGLSLSQDGVISGTPTEQGKWEQIEVKAKNARGEATFKTELLVLQYYNVTAAVEPAEGGSVTGTGRCQQGMRYTLTATPNSGYDFIGWYDENGQLLSYDPVYEKSLGWGDVHVKAMFAVHTEGAPVIKTTWLPNGAVNRDYAQQLTAEGDAPVNWSVADGSLPQGLTLSQGGMVSGKPTDWNTYVFTVQAENTKGKVYQKLTLRNAEEPSASYTVTYHIENGTWADGSDTDKTETVEKGLNPSQVPAGMTPKNGFANGAWDTDPERAIIGADCTFTYRFSPAQLLSNDAALQSLAVNGASLSPAFRPDTTQYTATVPNSTTSVTINAVANDAKATVTVKWTQLPSTERRVDVRGFSDADIPQSLKNAGYDTTSKIQNALLKAIIKNSGSAYGKSFALYEVQLMISLDGGATWVAATPENFPSGGITVTLPYPTGTGRTTHNFSVAHMFTVAMRGHLPGQTETPPVTKTDNDIQVTLDGLSPVLVSWTEVTEQREQSVRGSQTGDDYERIGIRTLVFLTALLLLLNQIIRRFNTRQTSR